MATYTICLTGRCKLSTHHYKDAAKEPRDEEMVTVYNADPDPASPCKGKCHCIVSAKHFTIDNAGLKTEVEEKVYESGDLNVKTQKAIHPKSKGKNDKDFWEISAVCIM